jgi:glyceraldehyde-3-phosphate dehydrogenase (NADP+)
LTPVSGQKIYIAGEWLESAKPLPVLNPYSGETFARTFLAEKPQVEKALAAAAKTFAETRALPAYRRAEICAAAAQKITKRSEDLAKLIAQEAGKPLLDARREVKRAAATFSNAAEEAKRLGGELLPMDLMPGSEGRYGLYRRFPLGPVLGITPFNFPLNLVSHKVAPAIACGCPFILKPSPKTPLTALLLAEILQDAGLPPGSFSVFPVEDPEVEKLVTDARVKIVSFTGSATVGWKLKGLVPKKKVLLELGGNAAVVVEPDADLDLAVSRVATGGFGYAGQTCISVQRVYVEESVFKKFVGPLVRKVQALQSGDPMDEKTQVGPLITEEAAKRVETWVKEAVAGGAKILCGGKRDGSFYEPTVLTDVKPDMKVSCEELFGPVVFVEPYNDYEKALAQVNAGPYGLQAGVFTGSLSKTQKAHETLEVGTVLINEVPTYRVDSMPYGGVKDSGFGREGVKYAIEDYTEPRLLVVNPDTK